MIKIHFDESLKDSIIKSETFWAFDTSTNEEYKTFFQKKNYILEKASIEKCDYIFLPYKWDHNVEKIKKYKNKNIIAFFNDDYEGILEIPENNFILFRTSTNRAQIKKNERIMPAFCESIPFKEPDNFYIEKKMISFCGAAWSYREQIINEIDKNIYLNIDFILNPGFQASHTTDKKLAKKNFVENMQNSLFVLCMRGAGNFSYRLYETLCCGRIPIIINSNMKLPLEKYLNWNEFSIIIDKEEIKFLDIIIDEFLEKKNIVELCKNNQKIWDEYFSPHGFIKNIKLFIEGE